MRVALFITCLADQFYAEAGVAAVRLLRALGVEVDFPEGQTCCGQPAFNAGYWDEARPLAKRTLEVFEEAEYVVLPSGSCTSMVKNHYPELLPGNREALAMAEKTYELSQFLVRVLGVEKLGEGLKGRRVAYHHGCHALRELGVREEPLLLLQNAGAEVLPWEAWEECCGFGGLFSVKLPEVSLAMADRMAILSRGRVAQVGTPEEVYRRPVTSEVARFIGETNLLAVEIIGQDAATVSVLSAAGVFTGILGDPHQKATAGQPAELSIRPEAWRPATVGEANAVTGVVVEKIYLGQRAQLTLRTQLGLLRIVIINPPGDLTTGHELTVAVASSDVVVLPRK